MQIPGMETVRDPAIGLREDSVLAANPPITRQRPLIERQRCGRGLGVNVILIRATRGSEILGAIRADIGLRGLDIGHVRGGLDTLAGDRDGARRDVLVPRLTQKLLDHMFGLGVIALAKMMRTNATIGVDEVMRRPVLVVEATPDRVVVVDRNGIIDAKAFHGGTNVVDVPLERELRRVNTDDDQALVTILLGPCLDIGACAGS